MEDFISTQQLIGGHHEGSGGSQDSYLPWSSSPIAEPKSSVLLAEGYVNTFPSLRTSNKRFSSVPPSSPQQLEDFYDESHTGAPNAAELNPHSSPAAAVDKGHQRPHSRSPSPNPPTKLNTEAKKTAVSREGTAFSDFEVDEATFSTLEQAAVSSVQQSASTTEFDDFEITPSQLTKLDKAAEDFIAQEALRQQQQELQQAAGRQHQQEEKKASTSALLQSFNKYGKKGRAPGKSTGTNSNPPFRVTKNTATSSSRKVSTPKPAGAGDLLGSWEPTITQFDKVVDMATSAIGSSNGKSNHSPALLASLADSRRFQDLQSAVVHWIASHLRDKGYSNRLPPFSIANVLTWWIIPVWLGAMEQKGTDGGGSFMLLSLQYHNHLLISVTIPLSVHFYSLL